MVQKSNANVNVGFKPLTINHIDTITGKIFTLDDFTHFEGLVVAFICNHCPYVKLIQEKLSEFARHNIARGIGFLAINSNDYKKYPEDSPEKMKKLGTKLRFPFPYIYDESQELAKGYSAACTPEFYLFSNKKGLLYHGRFDDATPGNNNIVSGRDLQFAIDSMLEGKLPITNQQPAIGCSIKWK